MAQVFLKVFAGTGIKIKKKCIFSASKNTMRGYIKVARFYG
jgi:hypothetical protein